MRVMRCWVSGAGARLLIEKDLEDLAGHVRERLTGR